MRRYSSAVLGVLALLVAGCAHRGGSWVLVYPPEHEDAGAPNGRRLLPKSPPHEWRRDDRFATVEACREEREARFAAAVARARTTAGDAAAPLDLDVRRAVHARCVAAGP